MAVQCAQRTARGYPSGGKQCVQGGRERADIVSARRRHVANHINANRPQSRKGNIRRDIAILGSQHLLHGLLHIGQASSADEKRSDFGQGHAPFPINNPHKPLRDSAPKIDRQAVTGTDDVVRADGKIHRNRSRVIGSIAECRQAKSLVGPLVRRRLHVHIVERWDIRVGIRAVYHPHRRHVFLFGYSPRVVCARRQFPSVLARKHFRGAIGFDRTCGQVPCGRQSIAGFRAKGLRTCQRIGVALGRGGSQFEVRSKTHSARTIQRISSLR